MAPACGCIAVGLLSIPMAKRTKVALSTPPDAAPRLAPATLLSGVKPAYKTRLGAAFAGDAVEAMRRIPTGSVDLVLTSPPYALQFKKEYGNVAKSDYVKWFLPFGHEIRRVLADSGSFVLNIGGSYNPGAPTRSLYHFKLLIALCEEAGFHLAQECFSYDPASFRRRRNG